MYISINKQTNGKVQTVNKKRRKALRTQICIKKDVSRWFCEILWMFEKCELNNIYVKHLTKYLPHTHTHQTFANGFIRISSFKSRNTWFIMRILHTSSYTTMKYEWYFMTWQAQKKRTKTHATRNVSEAMGCDSSHITFFLNGWNRMHSSL